LGGFPDAVSFDMGGTSTDVCLVRGGVPEPTPQRSIAGLPIRLPALDVHTIGAGGGSIARIDAGGALVVGPDSAGAVPGPACYGRGGEKPTVTDADLVLGRIPDEAAFPGLGRLDVDAATRAIERERVAADGVDAALDRVAREAVALVGGHDVEVERLMDCRYVGQSHELTVAGPDEFPAEHERRNGFARPGAPVEVVALRVRARRPAPLSPADLP